MHAVAELLPILIPMQSLWLEVGVCFPTRFGVKGLANELNTQRSFVSRSEIRLNEDLISRTLPFNVPLYGVLPL